MRLFIAIIAIFTLQLMWSPFAEANISYSVTPLIISHEVEQRDIIKEEITVTNTGQTPVTLFPMVNNITLGSDGGVEEFVPRSMADRGVSLANWIEISRRGLELMPGASETLPVTLRVNLRAEVGEYHAMVTFAHGTTRDEAERRVQHGQAGEGTIFSVTVPDDKKESLRLSKFLIKTFITQESPEDISYTLNNPGDTTIVPSGEVILYNKRGEEVRSIPLNADGNSVAPGESFAFTAGVPTEGLVGKYKAFLSLEYGSDQLASINDTAFFYIVPWKVLLAYFVAIVATVLIATFVIVRRRARYEAADDDDIVDLPLYLRDNSSDPHDRDIDLKKNGTEN